MDKSDKKRKSVPVDSPEGKEARRTAMAKLEEWLTKIDATCAWQLVRRGHDNKPHSYIEAWTANGRVFIVVRYAEMGGWDIYTAADTAAIDATLADVEARIGLK